MAKKNFYNISNLLSTKAQWLMLLGQRANGKSYQVKLTCLNDAYKHDSKFIYLRRWKEDIKASAVEKYFTDMPISKITDGEYDSITAFRNNLYFSTTDDTGKKIRGKEIGSYCALNESERYKSWAFKGYEYIIYEEFITNSTYLVDEPVMLQQFVSTVARLEPLTVFLVGNTLSRVCPYFSEWCLEGVLTQKQGTIEIYHYHVNGSTVDIAVEYCANAKNENTMFFGEASKQIITGEWEVHDVPKLPRKLTEYEMVYELLVEYQAFKFVMQLLIEPTEGGAIVYIYPYTGHRKFQRIITDRFSDSRFESNRLNIGNKAEKLMQNCFRIGKVCFSDNLTGSDFNHVNEVLKMV